MLGKYFEDFQVKLFPKSMDGRKAHLLLPWHIAQDAAEEKKREKSGTKIGTTLRGIGPAFQDKAARSGLRVGYLTDPSPDVRIAAIEALALVQDPSVEQKVLALLQDPVELVRSSVKRRRLRLAK